MGDLGVSPAQPLLRNLGFLEIERKGWAGVFGGAIAEPKAHNPPQYSFCEFSLLNASLFLPKYGIIFYCPLANFLSTILFLFYFFMYNFFLCNFANILACFLKAVKFDGFPVLWFRQTWLEFMASLPSQAIWSSCWGFGLGLRLHFRASKGS